MMPMARALVIIVIALGVTHAVVARTHHRVLKRAAPVSTTHAANVPEKGRDPADVALDRKIKGICRGC
jgi:hypothetical protein